MPRKKGSRKSNLQEGIKTVAWEQIGTQGAASLSLRAIARELHITAPAIYNYFPSRDDLVTALIVDAFNAFADSQQEAIAPLPASDHQNRLRALGLAYRQWAVTFPQRYHLIFGTPIPGYVAPVEITMPPAARGLRVLVGVLAAAHDAGELRFNPELPMEAEVAEMLQAWQTARASGVAIEALNLALSIWGRVHGLVMLEIGYQYPPFITHPGAIYKREVERIIKENFNVG